MVSRHEKESLKEEFRTKLLEHVEVFNSTVSAPGGDWVVKGFIEADS